MVSRAQILLLFTAGCTGEVFPVSVTFSIEEDTCGTTDMAEVELNGDCGGTIEVHLLDKETPGQLFGSQCIDLGGTKTHFVDDLPELIAPNFKVSAPDGAVVELQVSVHSSPLARSCDDAPRRLITDQPVVSGESPDVTLEKGAVIHVSLSCPSKPLTCALTPVVDNNVAVASGVRDLGTLQFLDDELGLDVSFGYVWPNVPSSDWDEVRDLLYADGQMMWDTPHRFVLADPLPGDCYATRVNWTDDTTLTTSSFVSCEGTLVGQNLTTQGYFASPAIVDEVVKAIGHLRVPPTGLLLGRVVDDELRPVNEAVVRADGADVAVHYFTDEVPMRLATASTGRNGWFAVDTWQPGQNTCCVYFNAQSADFEGRTVAPIGLTKALVTTTLIRAEPRTP
jgi:hypothetical protein